MLRAAGTGSAPRLLAASAVAASTTGSVTENTLATVTIPAGVMGTSGGLHIYSTWSYTNSANNKTPRVRLGGVSGSLVLAPTLTTTAVLSDVRRLRNRGAANSQSLSFPASAVGSIGSTASTVITMAVDMSIAQDLVFSGQLALGTETLTLENYEVWLVP